MGSEATTDRQRLLQVAQALAQAASAPPGRNGKRRLPVLQPQDAAGLVAMLHEQMDEAVDDRNRAAAAAGVVIACERGCNSCCQLPVVVGEHEALGVSNWLSLPENAAVRARFLAAYPGWRAKLGATVEDVMAASSEEELEAQCATYSSKRAMCPLNHDGDCSVYPVRPALCRKTHAVNSNAKCVDEFSEGVDLFIHPPLEATYQEQQPVRAALHRALRPDHFHDMLPKAVMRRLTSATAFPNQPCPCGSGQKQKRCCGAG
jgi:SEC-C motif